MTTTYKKIQDLSEMQSGARKLESALGEHEHGRKDDTGTRKERVRTGRTKGRMRNTCRTWRKPQMVKFNTRSEKTRVSNSL